MSDKINLSPQDMARLSTLLYKMSHDPKTREDTARVMARVDPQAAKAFADVQLKDQFAQFRKEMEDEKLRERVAQAQTKQRDQRKQLAGRFSEEQIVEIEKNYMTPLGLGDYLAASKIYAADNPATHPELIVPPEVESGGATWEFPTVPGKDGKMLSFEDFAKNPVKASRDAAIQVITEFKRARLPGAFQRA
jgi:hypothetical protein